MYQYQRGDTLKLSEEGLNHIYKYNPGGRERASRWRFKYRCPSRRTPECITVILLGKGYYRQYHHSFLELAEGS